MKLKPIDILAILRLYGEASDDNVSTEITRVTLHTPSTHNKAVSFVFQGQKYCILIDDSIADEAQVLEAEFHSAVDTPEISLLENLAEETLNYSVPYKGKTFFLAKLTDSKQRLDKILFAKYGDAFSRSSLQAFIKQGCVTVNGTPILTPSKQIDHDAIVELLPPKNTHQALDLPIIFEDENVIVIDKPAGIMTHPKNERDIEPSVAGFIAPKLTEPNGDKGREGIVHRLDRDTSGVILCTKNKATYEYIKAQFANRTVQKTYYAVLERMPKTPEAIIDAPIARATKNQSLFKVDARGKQAVTQYSIEHTSAHPLVKLMPKTGRTHQLRVHMAYINAPILGDRMYGTATDRLYLHAHQLNCTLPDGTEHQFVSAIPEEFIKKSHA